MSVTLNPNPPKHPGAAAIRIPPRVIALLLVALFLPFTQMASAVDTMETVNQLLAEGRFADTRIVLQAALVTGTGEEKARTRKMLEQLDGYLGARRAEMATQDPTTREPTPDGTYAVTHLGGYEDGWIVVATRDSDFTTQRMSGFSAQFPSEWIQREWKEELRITTLSGDENGWCVVMSRTIDQKAPIQSYFGPAPVDDNMEKWIKKQAEEGLRITAVAGWQDQWVVVMTADTGWGTQRYLRPGKSETEITDWWHARRTEGFAITAMNGDFVYDTNTKQHKGASFMLVATEGLKIASQELEIGVPFPGSAQINTDAPVRIIAGYGKNKMHAIVLRGGSPIAGSRQAIATSSDCEVLIRQIWKFHEQDAIAKQQKTNTGE